MPPTITVKRSVDNFLRAAKLAPLSKKAYRIGLAKFLAYLTEYEGVDINKTIRQLTAAQVVAFGRSLVPPKAETPDEVSQLRTAMNNISVVRNFLKFVEETKIHPTFRRDVASRGLRALLSVTPLQEFHAEVNLDDLEKIVTYVRQDDSVEDEPDYQEIRRLKVKAIILFLYETGVRLTELVALQRRDFDLQGQFATIFRDDHPLRSVTFSEETKEALAAYWEARDDGPITGHLTAFTGRDNRLSCSKPIAQRTVEHILAQLCKKVGVEGISPHSFRYAVAVRMAQQNVPASTFQEVLGYISLQTVQGYKKDKTPSTM